MFWSRVAVPADWRHTDSGAASVAAGAGALLATLIFASAGFRAAYDPGGALILLAVHDASLLNWRELVATLLPGVPYSPLALLTLLFDNHFWPFVPTGTFVLNAAIHSTNVALAHRLFSAHARSDHYTPVIASSLLAILPQSLAHLFSVTARAPILSLTFLLLALIAQRRHITTGRGIELGGSLILYALSLLSCSWAILVLPLLCVRSVTHRARRLLQAAGYVAVVALFLTSAPDGACRETLLPPAHWSWPRLLLSVLPFPVDMPRADLKYFLMLCWLALYALGLRGASERMPSVLAGLVWFVPSLLAAAPAHPEPIGTGLLQMYLFTPGLALIMSGLAAKALDAQDRQRRAFGMLVFAGVVIGYLSLSSIISVRIHFRTKKVEERIDEIRQAAADGGRPIQVVLAASHTSDPYEYGREAWHYVDLLQRARSRDPESPLTTIGAGEDVWVRSNGVGSIAEAKAQSIGERLVRLESLNTGKLAEDPRTLLLAFDEERFLISDSLLSPKTADYVGCRYPHWTGRGLGEWSGNGARLRVVENGLEVECGGADAYVTSSPIAWPAAAIARVKLLLTVLKTPPDARARMYWDTNLREGFTTENSLEFQVPQPGGGPVSVDVPLSESFAWCTAGIVQRIRLALGSGTVFRIHAVTLLPRGEHPCEPAGGLETRWSSGPGYSFELDRAEPSDEVGCFRAVTEYPGAIARLDLDSAGADILRLRMRCSMADRRGAQWMEARVFWTTVVRPEYHDAYSVGFPVLPDNQVRTYEVRLAHCYEWLSADRITSLRIVPFAASGQFCIEDIEVLGCDRLHMRR